MLEEFVISFQKINVKSIELGNVFKGFIFYLVFKDNRSEVCESLLSFDRKSHLPFFKKLVQRIVGYRRKTWIFLTDWQQSLSVRVSLYFVHQGQHLLLQWGHPVVVESVADLGDSDSAPAQGRGVVAAHQPHRDEAALVAGAVPAAQHHQLHIWSRRFLSLRILENTNLDFLFTW